jgi:hypothetical protein
MSEHEHTEPEPDEREEGVEDLEVPEGQKPDVAGGADDRLTESISLNRR